MKVKSRMHLSNGNYLAIEADSCGLSLRIVDADDSDIQRPVAIIRPFMYPTYMSRSEAESVDVCEVRRRQKLTATGASAVVKERIEVLFAHPNAEMGEDTFDPIFVPHRGRNEPVRWEPYIRLRETQFRDMIPAGAYDAELLRVPLYDGYELSAVAGAEKTVYIGVKFDGKWWQNLCCFEEMADRYIECSICYGGSEFSTTSHYVPISRKE